MARRSARLTREEHLVVADKIRALKRDLNALGHYLGGKVKVKRIEQVLAVGRRLDAVRSDFDNDWFRIADDRSPYYGGEHGKE